MTLQEAYARLKEHFGTHRAAAEYLIMTEQHYSAYRNGRETPPPWREDHILRKASELSPSPPLSTSPPENPEARP